MNKVVKMSFLFVCSLFLPVSADVVHYTAYELLIIGSLLALWKFPLYFFLAVVVFDPHSGHFLVLWLDFKIHVVVLSFNHCFVCSLLLHLDLPKSWVIKI